MKYLLFIFCFLLNSCIQKVNFSAEISIPTKDILPEFDTNFIAKKFRIPVGVPPGKNYYDANPFMNNYHLGEDWNGVKGGNSDLGDPVYATASGQVSFAKNIAGGWGRVVMIHHQLQNGNFIESLYGHLDSIWVNQNQYVTIGQQIGTIGDCFGKYPAHLHFEIRKDTTMEIGPGYDDDTTGYLNPKKFIKEYNFPN